MENVNEKDRLVSLNTGLVHACAKKFTGRGVEYEELYSCGCVGLVKAAKRFDPGLGYKFSTYAVPVILGEIKLMFRDSGMVKVSRSLKEIFLKVRDFSDSYEKERGEAPSVSDIACGLGLEAEVVEEALCASKLPLSLSYTTEDDERELEIREEGAEDRITERITLYQVLDTLSASDRELIEQRYFRGKTQSATAEILGTTQVQVSRREKKILAFLREKMAG